MNQVHFELTLNDEMSLIIPKLERSEEIFTLINDDRAHLGRWLPWVENTRSVADTQLNVVDRIEGFKRRNQASFFGTLNGKIIASVGFINHDAVEGEIGYWLLSSHTGQGLMTKYVRACVDFGFGDLQLKRIHIKCDAENESSIAIPKRLHFKQKKSEREDNREILLFTLENKDWRK
jgi:ribosomal-protein-serine acetyltransferase